MKTKCLIRPKDIKKILDYITEEGKDDIAKVTKRFHFNYGNHSEKNH
jgi:hypothetical protein